tara:strand:+ start:637 stop:1041 length:405 start_codon:yes stop_codon:yes gene_type:complete
MRYKILSLIDITKTKVRRGQFEDVKIVNQFSNYMAFENSLLLRSNMNSISTPTSEIQDITNLKFGDNYVGEHMVWTTVIEPDFPDAVSIDTLQEDFDLVPMLIGLNETVNIKTGVFRTKDLDYTNVLFIKQIDN